MSAAPQFDPLELCLSSLRCAKEVQTQSPPQLWGNSASKAPNAVTALNKRGCWCHLKIECKPNAQNFFLKPPPRSHHLRLRPWSLPVGLGSEGVTGERRITKDYTNKSLRTGSPPTVSRAPRSATAQKEAGSKWRNPRGESCWRDASARRNFPKRGPQPHKGQISVSQVSRRPNRKAGGQKPGQRLEAERGCDFRKVAKGTISMTYLKEFP